VEVETQQEEQEEQKVEEEDKEVALTAEYLVPLTFTASDIAAASATSLLLLSMTAS
jgi:hypothetical protein